MSLKKVLIEGDTKLSALGLSEMNVKEETNKENCLIIEIDKIEDTPFSIVKTDDEEKCFIAVGNKRISELMSEGKAKMRIADKDWGLIVQLIAIVGNGVFEELETKKN